MKKSMTVLTLALGVTLAVLVAGSASAASPKKTHATSLTATKESPGDSFFVVNGTVNAASDHEIIGSSAFPNFTTGAVDNYYSMAHAHVDNSPFAEGTASPADTGPVGQTAAAGNTQQPQYADARWPGTPDKATYGNQGGPYAAATAGEYRAEADASEATNGLSGPGLKGMKTLAVPKGFDGRLRQALAAWQAKWHNRLGGGKPAPPTVKTPPVPVPTPKAPVSPPSATVTTPIATVTTPDPGAGAPVPVPTPPPLPSAGAMQGSRSLAALRTSRSTSSTSTSGDGESLLASSAEITLVPTIGKGKAHTTTSKTKAKTKAAKTKAGKTKAYALVTKGESSLGRVTLGGGQIVIEGIHVTASITNDGTPSYKVAVSVASATIGGVPVTIDQDGVHLAGQGQGLPYQQASDALNSALKQAGIQLFLVGPEVKTTSCGEQTGAGGGTTAPSTSSNQSGASSPCDQTGAGAMCDQAGTGAGGGTPTPAAPTPALPSQNQQDATAAPGACDQAGAAGTCDQAGSGTGSGTSGAPSLGSSTTPTTTSSDRSTTTTTPSSCDQSGMSVPTSTCTRSGRSAGGTTTTSTDRSSTATTPSSSDQLGLGAGMPNSREQTVTATGVHVVFTQPVNQSGVPAQFVEHILGEVYLDSLATPAGPVPKLGLFSSSLSSSCLGGGRSTVGGASTAGGSGLSAGGSTSAGSLASSGSGGAAFGSASQPGASSSGASLPAAFATALRKPLWLLLAYLVWQLLVIGTGWSLWNWRRGGTS